MPPTLIDVLSILNTIKPYAEKSSASRKYVVNTFYEMPIRKARILDYGELENLCVQLGLIEVHGDLIDITLLGESIREYRSAQDPGLATAFIRDVIMGPSMAEKMGEALDQFYVNNSGVCYYPKDKVYDLFAFPAVMPILYEIGLLEKDGPNVIINPAHEGLGLKRITQKQLDLQLLHKKDVGAIGEEIALVFEKNRLGVMGCTQESDNVRLISLEFSNAGYDMESFDRDRNGNMRRIYVEVKGSTSNKMDFYWSANEIATAKRRAEDYWIYFVPCIDTETRSSSGDIIRLQDPYKVIFVDRSFKAEPGQYHVSEN